MISLSNGDSSSSTVSSGYSGYFRNRIEVFDETPGTKQLTIPSGWNRIRVAVVGGGGAGAAFTSGNDYNNGGGGGGYSEITLDVVPGQVYSYTVGAGGTTGKAGGTSSFGGLISATGGGKAINYSTAAAGGVGIGGTVNTAGGKGGAGANSSWGSGGGSSANRFGNGGDGLGVVVSAGVPGGSWPNYPRPLLYDDGFGLGITPYTPPISFVGAVIRTAANTSADTTAYNALSPIMSVGMGQLDRSTRPNIGGGKCGSTSSPTPSFTSAGIGGGDGGAPAGYNIGGNGLVIVEVLE